MLFETEASIQRRFCIKGQRIDAGKAIFRNKSLLTF